MCRVLGKSLLVLEAIWLVVYGWANLWEMSCFGVVLQIFDTLCRVGDQFMWGLRNYSLMIQCKIFLHLVRIRCSVGWFDSMVDLSYGGGELIRVRAFPFMEAHVLKVEAFGSVWVTVIWWFSLISLISMDTPVCIMTAFGYLIVCLWLKTSYIIPI